MGLARKSLAFGLLLGTYFGVASASADDWRHSAVWDDGNSEYCVYEVLWSRYGNLYEGQASLILVKEPWAPDLEVKADRPRADGFEVLKLNHVRHVQTGVYAYHQMASAFLRRDTGKLRKLSVTSSEACGISTAYMVDGRLNTRSYFDGQGERDLLFPSGAVAEDTLAAVLRDFVEGDLPGELSVFPSLMSGRLSAPEPRAMRLSRAGGVAVELADGAVEGVELRLSGASGGARYVFARESPHPLLMMQRDDGTTYRLAKCERIPYWRMAGPGGEAWLPESIR